MTKVLVITNDDDLRELCECVLPFRVRSVTPGAHRALTVPSEHPDVILVDVFEPDDWKLVGELRDSRATKHIPLVVLTVWISADRVYRNRARELGCKAFVTKPCDVEILEQILIRAMHGEDGIEFVRV